MEGGKAVYSKLLAALTADRPIGSVAKMDSANCEISYIRYRRERAGIGHNTVSELFLQRSLEN